MGDRQIAHDWAFHKVYYLISQLKFNENNEALIENINDLCARFHIITPYSFSVRNPAPNPLTKPKVPVPGSQPTGSLILKK
jgi:hypothetical protein